MKCQRPAGNRARRKGSNKLIGSRYIAQPFLTDKPIKPAFKSGFRGKIRLCLHDEAPRLGSGWRVFYVMVGHKWVRVYDPASGGKKRMSRKLFDSIAASTAANIHRNNQQQQGVQL